MTSNVGTPDGQRGVVSAQVLLAVVEAGSSVTVGVPPNAETIVVAFQINIASTPTIEVHGTTTDVEYAAVRVTQVNNSQWVNYWIDATSVLDEQIAITPGGLIENPWYVYADAGVHLTADMATKRQSNGVPFSTPAAPGPGSLDHPPNELRLGSASGSANFTILAAPGAGNRIRLFSVFASAAAGGVDFAVQDGLTSAQALHVNAAGPHVHPIPLTGVPLSSNAALDGVFYSGSTNINVSVTYIIEAV